MTATTDGGDAVISAFDAAGADYIFSSPGSEWAPVWESIARRHRDGLPCPKYLDLTHETVAVRRWLVRRPRIHPHFTPTGASWTDMVERWLATSPHKQIRRGAHGFCPQSRAA